MPSCAVKQTQSENLSKSFGISLIRFVAIGLHFLGEVERKLGEHREAQTCLHESLTLSKSIGDRWVYSLALNELGQIAHAQGEYVEATRLF